MEPAGIIAVLLAIVVVILFETLPRIKEEENQEEVYEEPVEVVDTSAKLTESYLSLNNYIGQTKIKRYHILYYGEAVVLVNQHY